MNGYPIFMVLLVGYISFLVATGYYFNKKQNSLREFMQAGKRAGGFSIGFSAAASWLTAGALLAVVGLFILLGMGSIWGFVAPNIIALIIIGLFVKKIRSVPAMTQPELLEVRYGSFLRTPVAIIIIMVMILFAVSDIKGFALVLEIFYGISNVQAALIVGLSVAIYVSLGGLSAVIATDVVQYLCLAFFVLCMSFLVVGAASDSTGMDVSQMALAVDGNWWNPLSVGMPMVLIFTLAIIPGWITEQDPWQKVWAAKSEKSARLGMFLGSLLVLVVFGGCAVIAIGLQYIYPEIVEAGFPMGMAKAEPALLTFILGQNYSDVVVALCAIALATAAMSCADTFAASGASCIARDLFQRHINPGASIKEMLMVNRLGVLFIIGCATLGSFVIDSIIDAIHIATFIASASYFFPLIGGMYWRKGTAAGAAASMVSGFICQSCLVVFDLMNSAAGAPPALESIHPILMGHGVIAAMTLSGIVYVAVSLMSVQAETFRLAPFFEDKAAELVEQYSSAGNSFNLPVGITLHEVIEDNRVYLKAGLKLPENLDWHECLQRMACAHSHWISFSGGDSIRRCTRPDMQSCVSLIRGEGTHSAWLEIEGSDSGLTELKAEVGAAYSEVEETLLLEPLVISIGII